MSDSLLRGLSILEMLASEPCGVSEIARALDVDKAGVSRMLASLHDAGWVRRTGARYVLGDRALRMRSDPHRIGERADSVTRALHDETGLVAVALELAGRAAQPIATAFDPGRVPDFMDADTSFEHLWHTAGGVALLSQVGDSEVDDRLARFAALPDAAKTQAPETSDEVWQLIRRARTVGLVEERSWSVPGLGCLAAPWQVPGTEAPLALAVVGPLDHLDAPGVTDSLASAASSP